MSFFARTGTAIFEDDLHTNDTALTATALRVDSDQPSDRDLGTIGSISDLTDVDFYKVRAPERQRLMELVVMTITLRAQAVEHSSPDCSYTMPT